MGSIYIYIAASKFAKGRFSSGNQLNRVLHMMNYQMVTGYFQTTIEFLVPGQKKDLFNEILEKIKWGDVLCVDFSSFETGELENLRALLYKKSIPLFCTRQPKKKTEKDGIEVLLEGWHTGNKKLDPLDYLQ